MRFFIKLKNSNHSLILNVYYVAVNKTDQLKALLINLIQKGGFKYEKER